jgi:hypothetical protein
VEGVAEITKALETVLKAVAQMEITLDEGFFAVLAPPL